MELSIEAMQEVKAEQKIKREIKILRRLQARDKLVSIPFVDKLKRGIKWNGFDSDFASLVNLASYYWKVDQNKNGKGKAYQSVRIDKETGERIIETTKLKAPSGSHVSRPDHSVLEDIVQDALIRQWSSWTIGKNFPIATYVRFSIESLRKKIARNYFRARKETRLPEGFDVAVLPRVSTTYAEYVKTPLPVRCLILLAKGYNQSEIASKFNCNQSTISRSIRTAMIDIQSESIKQGISLLESLIEYVSA